MQLHGNKVRYILSRMMLQLNKKDFLCLKFSISFALMTPEVQPDLLKQFISTKSILKYSGIALLIRLLILAYFIYNTHVLFPDRLIDGFIFRMNDYEYFLGTIDNYFDHGTMTYLDQAKPFAGRMPGYGFPYLLIREFTGREAGLAILMGLQILLSSVATCVLALTALLVFRNSKIFHVVFWSFAICAPTIIFDIFTLSESFSISAIIFFHFFLLRFTLENRRSQLLLAGFFLAWAIFLRPFLGLFIAIVPLYLLWSMIKAGKKLPEIITLNAIFLLPFIVFESAWVTRNYISLHRFIPLETSLTESYGENGAYRTSAIGIRSMINAWGGETGEFYDGSDGWWFHHAKGDDIKSYVFKPYVFNADFTRDSLVALKYIFNQSINQTHDAVTRDSLNMLANRIALRYADNYKEHNAVRCYLINPFKMFSRLVFANGTRLLILPSFSQMNMFEKAVKVFYMLFYYGFIFSGIAGMIIFIFKKELHKGSVILYLCYPWIIACTLVFYASFVILEYRYMISAFPVFILFGVYCFFNFPLVKNRFPADIPE